MYLICGIHGSGKTTYCRMMEKKERIPYFSASDLINKTIKLNQNKTKKIDQIDGRQAVLVSEVKKIREQYKEYILDGHLCLINDAGKIERIQEEVFCDLGISKIYVVKTDEKLILDRMKKRDDIDWTLDFVKSFQREEIKYAKYLSETYGLELKIIDATKKDNIILPISPIYVEKILNGQKKYEFRKKLAKKEVKKIYIYATTPVKKIVGEVEVKSKIVLPKEQLWIIAAERAGVTKEFYSKYFEKQNEACAYELGDVLKYNEGIMLKELGIKSVPQAFVYSSEF